MVFQQRNGRVDRYGQDKQPLIVYLHTETNVERIKGDLRILEILQTKDEQANKNLGDPASFLHVFDPEMEAAKVADIMAAGTSPEQFESTIDAAQASSERSESGDGEDDGDKYRDRDDGDGNGEEDGDKYRDGDDGDGNGE